MKRLAVFLFLSLLGAWSGAISRETYHQRIQYWIWKEDWTNALFEAGTAHYEHPYDAWFAAWAGVALTRQGRDGEAPDYFVAARRLSAGDSRLETYVLEKGYLPWAEAAKKQNLPRVSPLGIYTAALTLYPENLVLWQKAAETLAAGRKFAWALDYWQRLAQSLNPKTPWGPEAEALKRGIREGLLQTWRTEPRVASAYGDLAGKFFPRDTFVMGPAVFAKVKTEGVAAARKMIKSLGWTGMDDYWELRIMLAAGQRWEAVEKLKTMAEKNSEDPQFLTSLGQTLEDELAGLNYAGRVADPLYYQALNFHAMAVNAWFKTHSAAVPFPLVPPMRGFFKITQAEGGPSFHFGLNAHFSYDFSYNFGAPIYAVADGVVEEVTMRFPDRPLDSAPDVWANGNRITIRHPGGFKSLYTHLKQESAKVRPGDPVKAGQEIAAQGNSGITLGSHLHYSLMNSEGISVPSRFEGLERAENKYTGPWEKNSILAPGFWYRTLEPQEAP